MGKLIDLTGMRFGKLVVVNRAEDYMCPSGQRYVKWRCRCDCGNELETFGHSLRCGDTKSCGCYNKERVSECNKKTNEYRIVDDYIVAKTSRGVEFYIDADDEWVFENYCFNLNSDGYLLAHDCNSGKSVRLHRLVMGLTEDDDYVVDHVDGNTLNNRKSNLRIVTQQQNCMNRRARSNNTSGITGVSYHKRDSKWQSEIFVNGKNIYLGSFSDFDDAVAARREAEERYFGEYSYHNSRVACSN